MKKVISSLLSVLTVASVLTACAPASDQLDPAITVASSDAATYAAWLDGRLEEIPDSVVLGIGSDQTYGVDMANFEEGGYILREMDGDVLIFGKSATGLDRAVRKYAKAVERGQTENIDETYLEGKRVGKITVAGRDISEYTVVHAPDETVSIPGRGFVKGNSTYAAQELVRLIEVACGAVLPTETADVEGPMIKIGYLDEEGRDINEFAYRVENGNIYIDGVGKGNGCAVGVYHLLENYCGWQGLCYGTSNLAEADTVDIPEGINEEIDPLFDGASGGFVSLVNERASASKSYTGIYGYAGENIHYWLEDNRYVYDEQPCYSSLEIFDTVQYTLQKYLDNARAAGNVIGENLLLLSFGMGDNMNDCTCRDCMKVFRDEGNAVSGNVVRFINKLEETMDELGYDGLVYGIMAYWTAQKPPSKAVPNDDIIVAFCTDAHCYVHPLEGGYCQGPTFSEDPNTVARSTHDLGQNNNDIGEWIRKWGEIANHLSCWYYTLDNGFSSYSMITNMYCDMKFLSEAGVDYVYAGGGFYGIGTNRISKMMAMDMWYNPDMTAEEYEIELCRLLEQEYGEGFEYVREYIRMQERSQSITGLCKNCWQYMMYSGGAYDWDYNTANSDKAFEYLEKAIAMADTAEQEKNCELLTIHEIYQGNLPSYVAAYKEGDEARLDVLRERHTLLISRMKKYGFNIDELRFDNGTSWPVWIEEELDREVWENVYYWVSKYRMYDYDKFPEPPDWVTETESVTESESVAAG